MFPCTKTQILYYFLYNLIMEKRMKNYDEKLTRMSIHLKNNPKDYQTSISYLKTRSKKFEQEGKQRQIEMLKKIQKYRGV